MNNKTGYGLRTVLGGYLAYLGIRMLIQTINDRPANMMFMGVMAVLFAVVGIAYAVYSLKKVWEIYIRKKHLKKKQKRKKRHRKRRQKRYLMRKPKKRRRRCQKDI